MAKDINIKYTDKDFSSMKGQLVELAKNYFPDSYNDFSPTSPGMMFIEMAAYVGDILSFYQDSQIQETFLQYAQDPGNLHSMAYMMGYKPRVSTSSTVDIDVTQIIAASGSTYEPDFKQAFSFEADPSKGAVIVVSAGEEDFFIDTPIDFSFSSSYDPTEVSIYSVDSNAEPAEFQLSKTVKAKSGKLITRIETVGTAQKFLTVEINDTDIIGIYDIVDSQGVRWTEVPYLGQDLILSEAANTGNNKQDVPYMLASESAKNRFVTRFTSTGQLNIQFGAGTSSAPSKSFLPDPTRVGSGTNQGVSRTDYAFDPSNFLFSDSYGNAPSNTTLTIRYITGGGIASNIEANTITGATYTANATDDTYRTSIEFTNQAPATGGKDRDTVEEIRQNSLRSFQEQGRIVTREDYAFRALTLPVRFGSIAKAFVTTDAEVPSATSNLYNPLGVCIYVLAYNNDRKLVKATSELKQNIKTYISQFKPLTDGCTIKDGYVVNVGIKYDIITLPSYNSRDVLIRCNQALTEHFNIDNWAINQPINLSAVYTLLDKIKGVQTVQDIKVKTKVGGTYSQYDYDIEGATKNNIVFPSLDPMIFEVKNPSADIQGRITTL
jgi:hypothetical protein